MRNEDSVAFNSSDWQQLKKLVSGGEGPTLEFKRKASTPERIVRELIAFANTKGGVLLVGVDDDKSIPGLKYPDDELLVIREALKKCKPRLNLSEGLIAVGPSRTVIQYEVKESPRKPHGLIVGGKHEVFVRIHDKSIKASREVREILRRSKSRKGIRFHFGDAEKLLMQYLDQNAAITLKKFCEISGLKKYAASRKFILLVLAGVLSIKPDERGDVYSLAYQLPARRNPSGN